MARKTALAQRKAKLAKRSDPDGANEAIHSHPPRRELLLAQRQTMFAGPLPPDGMLAGYEKALPGSADRIVKMAEKEQDHRHSADEYSQLQASKHDQYEFDYLRRSQMFALVIAIFGLAVSACIILKGYAVSGTILAALDISGIVGSFLYSAHRNRQFEADARQMRQTPNASRPALPSGK